MCFIHVVLSAYIIETKSLVERKQKFTLLTLHEPSLVLTWAQERPLSSEKRSEVPFLTHLGSVNTRELVHLTLSSMKAIDGEFSVSTLPIAVLATSSTSKVSVMQESLVAKICKNFPNVRSPLFNSACLGDQQEFPCKPLTFQKNIG